MAAKNSLITILLLFIVQCSYTQYFSSFTNYTDIIIKLQIDQANKGIIRIHQDEKLHLLVNKHVEYCQKYRKFHGYRIRIFSDHGIHARQDALSSKAKFLNNFPDIDAYFVYDDPFYKVYIGDFPTRSSAYIAFKKIVRLFPKSFIVQDEINFP